MTTADFGLSQSFTTMKSDRLIPTLCAVALFAVTLCASQQTSYQANGAHVSSDHHYYYLMANMYKLLYCDQKQCPQWSCKDDSAVIHGYCCGCPAPLLNQVSVPCVDDLKCPLRSRELCEHYHFMTTCCC